MMDAIAILLATLLSISFGVTEGVVYHIHPPKNRNTPDEHFFYTINRFIAFTAIVLVSNHWYFIALFILSTFPLLHDGAYYQTRKHLSGGSVYPAGWKTSKSHSTSAVISFKFTDRLALACAGILACIGLVLLKVLY
jgi:hypothetical protein